MGYSGQTLIYGAGAVGGYLGALLSMYSPTTPLTLLARPRFAAEVSAHGLRLHNGDAFLTSRPQVITSTADAGLYNLIILTVRAFDVAPSIGNLQRLLAPEGVVVAMQNGVGTEETLANALGRARVIAGTLTVSTGMQNAGTIVRHSTSGGLALASMHDEPPAAWVQALFAATGLPLDIISDYRRLRWSKLLLNMLGAATSAVLDIDMATLVRHPDLFRAEQLAFREAVHAMRAQGIAVVGLPSYPVPLVRAIMRLPRAPAQQLLAPRLAASRGGRAPKMREDMHRGRSEIRWLNGAVAQATAAKQLQSPVNSALTELVLHLTDDPTLQESFRGRPDMLIDYLRKHGARRL